MQIRSTAAPLAVAVLLAAVPAQADDTRSSDSDDEEETGTDEGAGDPDPEAGRPDGEGADPPSGEVPAQDSSEAELRRLRDELELMKLRLSALESTPPESTPPGPVAPNVFNPRITGFIDLVGAVTVRDGGVLPSFDVRAFELDFRADIDPFAKAVVVLGFENPVLAALEEEADEDGGPPSPEEVGEAWLSVVEEANITFVALPAHLLLELGIVRVDFGGLNRSHLHDVPHLDYPGAMAGLLGEEGWSDAGVFLRYRLHNPKSLPIDFKVGVLSRGPEPLMEGRQTPTPILLGRFTGSADFGAGSLFSGGLSYAAWRDATSEARGFHLASADFLLKLRPPRRGRYNSFFLQGEAYFSNRFGEQGRNSLAGFLGLGFQPARPVFLALRADVAVDDLAAPEPVWGAGFAASLYTSEFLRVRLAYDLIVDDGPAHRLGLQVTGVFGSHPVEPYWVNR